MDEGDAEKARSINSFSEVVLRMLAVAIYSSVPAKGRATALKLAAGLGPIGTWHQLVDKLARSMVAAAEGEAISELVQWLRGAQSRR